MRVAFDARSLAAPAPRGWDRYAIGLAGALAEFGVEVVLLRGNGLLWEQFTLPRALRHVDLYHAPAEHAVPLLGRTPAVLTIHSATAQSFADLIGRGLLPGPLARYLPGAAAPRPLADLYWRLQVARAAHVLTPSHFSAREIVRLLGVAPERVTVTPLGLSEEFFRPPAPADRRAATLARLGATPPYVLYVGGYEPHKNVEGLLAAFDRVRAVHRAVSLVLVGTGPVPMRLERQAVGLRFHGARVVPLSDLTDDLVDLYDGAAAFATLSWRESFGLPALEALARDLPVVASAWGAAPEVLGDHARLVDPRDTAAAAQAILDALDEDPTDRSPLTTRRSPRVAHARRFTWARTADLTLTVYRTLVGASC